MSFGDLGGADRSSPRLDRSLEWIASLYTRPWWQRCAVGAGLALIGVIFRLLLAPTMGDIRPYSTFWVAVMAAALLGGAAAAITATAGAVLFVENWLSPVTNAATNTGLAIFVVSCVIMTLISEVLHMIWDRSRRAEVLRAKRAWLDGERLRLALSAGEIGAWDFDPAKNVSVSDEKMHAIYGLEPDAVMNPKVVYSLLPPDDAAVARAALTAALDSSGDGRYFAQYRIRRPSDGAERWIEARAQAYFEHGRPIRAVGIARDVTNEKLAKLALEERAAILEKVAASEERLRAVIEGAGDAIISVDESGLVQSFNVAGERMFAYARDEVVGSNVEVLVPEFGGGLKAASTRGYNDDHSSGIAGPPREVEGRRKDGSRFPVEIAVSEANYEKKRLFVAFVRDLSALRQIEARIEQLRAERLTAMGGMAVALAHEINQPFLATAAYLSAARQLLATPPDQRSATIESVLELAIGQTMRAGRIIAHLREFAAGGEPDKTFQNLHELIDEAHDFMGERLRRSAIRSTLRLDAERPRVLADKVQIRQVLINLIRNAAQAMAGSDKRELTISTAETAEGMIRVDVVDTGCGVAVEALPTLFEPFATTKIDGLGVGLSISRSIIEAHFGELWTEPNPGGGAIFRFTLPSAAQGARDG